MPGTVFHVKTNTVPDITNSGYGVLPSDWNSSHQLTLSLSGPEIIGAFGNNSRVSFGTNGFGQITGNFGGIGGTDISGAFANNSMASVGTNASGLLTLSINAVPAITLSAGGTSTSGNAVALLNGNGVSFGLQGPFITASIQPGSTVFSGPAIQVSGQPILTNSTVVFTGSNVTLSQVGQTINVIGNPAQTSNLFSNSNGVSFGTNGSTVTASINPITLINSNSTYSVGSVYLYGTNNVTLTGSGSSLSISGPTITSLAFSNMNGVTFGVNASTLTASVSQTLQPAVAVAVNGFNAITSGTAVLYAGSNITLSESGQSISVVGPNPVTSNTLGISAAGNIAGAPVVVSLGTLALYGGNNVTLSQSTNSITISANAAGATVAHAAGGVTNNLSYVEFDNSNGVSFGLSGSSITASVNTTQRTLSINATNITVNSTTSTGGTTLSFSNSAQSAYQFSNSNGVSFGTSGSTVTASVAPAGITLSAGTTTGTITNLTLSNSNNVSFGLSNGVVTASASYTTQTNFVFSNSNGVSFGTSGSTVTASVVTSAPGIQISAGASLTQSATQIVFSNSNNVNFGLSNNTITASAIQQSITVSASGSSGSYAGLTFSNSNSVTFGNSQGVITATVSYPAASFLSLFPAGNTSGNSTQYTVSTGGNYIVGGNNVTISQTSNSLYINAGSATAAAMTFSAGTASSALGSIIFSNINNVSWGLSAGSIITGSVNNVPAMTISGSNTSATTPILKFSNGGGVSWSYDTGGSFIQGSINTNNNITVAAGGSTNTVNQVVFSNSNSVSFGLSGSTVTATVSYPAQTSLSFSNLNNISFGIAGSTVTGSVAPPTVNIVVSDSATSSNFTTIKLGTNNGMTLFLSASSIIGSYTVPTQTSLSFVNSNNVSFGINASSITATATFAQSNQNLTFSANNGSFAQTALSLIVGTGNVVFSTSNNSKLYAVAYQSLSAGVNAGSCSELVYSNSNNVSFGFDGNSVLTATATISQSVQPLTVSCQNGVGTYTATALSFENAGNILFNTNAASHVVGVAQLGITANSTAGFFAAQNFVLTNSNNISWTVSTNALANNIATIMGSASFAQAANTISAGTTSGTFNALTLSNSNNVSFGLNASTITASASFSQTVQPLTVSCQNGVGTYTANALSFENAANILFNTNAASHVYGFAILNFSGSNTSANLANIVFSNSNNVSFGLSANGNTGTFTASIPAQSNQTVGLYLYGNTTLTSSGTVDARTISISLSTNITGAYSNGYLILSGGAGGGGGVANLSVYATGTNTTIATSGTNNGAFYISAAGGILSAGVSSNTIYISGPGSTSFAPLSVGVSTQGNTAGITGFFTNQWQAVGGSNITLSQTTNTNGGTFSIIGGAPASQSVSANGNLYLSTTSGTAGSTFIFNAQPLVSQWSYAPGFDFPVGTSQLGNSQAMYFPLIGMPPLTATQLAIPLSILPPAGTNSSGNISLSIAAALYTIQGGSSLNMVTASSGSQNYTFSVTSTNNNVSITGLRDVTVPMNINYSGGDIWLAVLTVTSGTNYGTQYSLNNICVNYSSYNGLWGANTANSINPYLFMGRSGNSALSLSAGVSSNAISGGGGGIGNMYFPLIKLRAV